MKDELAERLLAEVLRWRPEEVAKERPRLQAIARYKYDRYHQFEPGMRFVESLATWLQQFTHMKERQAAYQFVMKRLVYISSEEMHHLVRMSYPDIMKAEIVRLAATESSTPFYKVKSICASTLFRVLRRRSLFLGLSDGAHTDLLRRANRDEIGHEQVYQSHEISHARAAQLKKKLEEDLREPAFLGRDPTTDEATFQSVFLLDDFTGSGKTYVRTDGTREVGKIAAFLNDVQQDGSALSGLVNCRTAHIYLVFYVATRQAIDHITSHINSLWPYQDRVRLLVAHELPDSLPITQDRDPEIYAICSKDQYFDPTVDDEHAGVGGASFRLGFSECALPLVLAHNSPNNSVAILWSYESKAFRGLFPRVPRLLEAGR